MTEQQILQEFRAYTPAQQIALIIQLSQIMQKKLEVTGGNGQINENPKIDDELSIAERMAIVESLDGCLHEEGTMILMNRQEEKETRAAYLINKEF